MLPRSIVLALSLLSLTGCVAAIPLAAQLLSAGDTASRLCAMATLPGQTASLCDRVPMASAAQPPGKTATVR